MPSFCAEVPHNLGQQGATDRLTLLVEQMKGKYADQVSDLDGSWNGNQLNYSFSTFGFDIAGSLAVQETIVRVEGSLPFALMAFRGMIEQQLKSELAKAMS